MAWRTDFRVGPFGEEADGRRKPPLLLRRHALLALLAAVVLALLSYVLYPTSSEVRWSLLLLLLIGVGWGVVRALYARSTSSPALEGPEHESFRGGGELERLVRIVQRGERGFPYSQGLVALRARSAFLTRLRTELGLPEPELRRLLETPARLRRYVKDPALLQFLEDTAAGEDLIYDPEALRTGLSSGWLEEGFQGRMRRVLRAMEAWP